MKRLLAHALIVTSAALLYALALYATGPGTSLVLAPLVSGVFLGILSARVKAGGRTVFTLGLAAGTLGSIILPAYWGSLGFHIRLSGEFLTTPVAVIALSYHGLATSLVSYTVLNLAARAGLYHSPPAPQGGDSQLDKG